jgi:CheY-like chemotaxis protein/anti-sigma regulatory factor (Ser/Thr protein kinase)
VRARFTVVLADDDDDARTILGTTLRRDGRFDVLAEVTDGPSAAEACARLAPDLLILDLAMPGGGGLEHLAEIRRGAPSTSVVAVTGFPGDRLETAARASGATGYVTKGLSPKRTVNEVIMTAGVLQAIGAVASTGVSLDKDVKSASTARRFVTETLDRWDCADLLDSITLLVSELVTNAVIHADSAPEMAIVLTSETLRVEVADRSDAMPVPREVDEFDTSGRGLALLDAMAERYGILDRPDGGKTVWFEVARPDQQGNTNPPT